MTFRHLLFAVLLVAFAASGCIFSPDPDPDPPAPPVIECTTATSPDEAMAAFKTAYEGRSLDCYRELLSESYLFIPQDDQASYGYDIEIDIARKMFEGLEGENGFVIQDITIDLLDPQGVWTETPANDPNFGGLADSQYRNYIVDIKFAISGQNLILRVEGPVLYYVTNEGTEDEPDFKILGMVDATLGG